MPKLELRLPEKLLDELQTEAERRGETLSELVRYVLKRWLESRRRKEANAAKLG